MDCENYPIIETTDGDRWNYLTKLYDGYVAFKDVLKMNIFTGAVV